MSGKWISGDIAQYLAGSAFKQIYFYAYPSTRVKYICKNSSISAALSGNDWYVWKYDDADLPRFEGPRIATFGIDVEANIDALAWGF